MLAGEATSGVCVYYEGFRYGLPYPKLRHAAPLDHVYELSIGDHRRLRSTSHVHYVIS
jgi:hypothetical protein